MLKINKNIDKNMYAIFFINFRRKSGRKLADAASLWSSGLLAKIDVGFT